jgi:hypothetical protein
MLAQHGHRRIERRDALMGSGLHDGALHARQNEDGKAIHIIVDEDVAPGSKDSTVSGTGLPKARAGAQHRA